MPLHCLLQPSCRPEGPRRPRYIPTPVRCRLPAGCCSNLLSPPAGAIERAGDLQPRTCLRQRAEHTNDHRTRLRQKWNEACNKPAELVGLFLFWDGLNYQSCVAAESGRSPSASWCPEKATSPNCAVCAGAPFRPPASHTIGKRRAHNRKTRNSRNAAISSESSDSWGGVWGGLKIGRLGTLKTQP